MYVSTRIFMTLVITCSALATHAVGTSTSTPYEKGDQQSLEVAVYKTSSRAALIKWKQVKFHGKQLLGYEVYSIEAPHNNVTLDDGRDGWREEYVTTANKDLWINHLLWSLKPSTQYAYFVKTHTSDSSEVDAISEIQYFRTLPDGPLKKEN